MPTIDDEIRALYGGPLEEFTAGKQGLAKRLKKSGDAAASRVAALRKPPPSAWGVNRLLQLEPDAMAALFAVAEGARRGSSAKAEGAPAVRSALDTVFSESARLSALALEWLGSPGAPPPAAAGERLRQNLAALALDPVHAPLVERGWLSEDLPPPGFEVLAGLQLAAAGRGSGPARASAPAAATGGAGASGAAGAERSKDAAKARELGRQLEAARAEVVRLEVLATEARQAAEKATAAVDRARREALEAEQRAFQVRREAAEADKLARAAAADVERARAALRRLEGSS